MKLGKTQVVVGNNGNECPISALHAESCCFADLNLFIFAVLVAIAVAVAVVVA